MHAKTSVRALACAVIVAGLALAVGAPASATSRDTQPPTAPTNLRVTAVTQTSVTLAWDPSTDNRGVVSYSAGGHEVPVQSPDFIPGQQVAAPQTTVTFPSLHPGTTYRFYVFAWDGINSSVASNPLDVTTNPDVVAPSAPTGLALVSTMAGFPVDGVTASTVLVTWTNSTDDFGPLSYQVLVNGVVSPNVYDTRQAGNAIWTTSTVWVRQLEPATTYTLTVRAVDGDGNASPASNAITVTTEPSSDTVAPTTPTLTRASDGGTSICPEELELRWTGSTDDVDAPTGIEYEVRINGRINDVFVGLTDLVTYTEIWGANTVTIVAVDRAGNASAASNARTVNIQWGVDYCM